MYSVEEIFEEGEYLPTVVANPQIWTVGNILLWPPGKNIDRKTIVSPGPDWKPYECNILKANIQTFEEALDLEKMYMSHRNSDSFREEQARKKLKREHPVNANVSSSNLIDFNHLISAINNNKDDAGESTMPSKQSKQSSNYHKSCVGKSEMKLNTITKKKTDVSVTKKPLPPLKNFSKIGSDQRFTASKIKLHDAIDATKPRMPRYDNFLKSGKGKGKIGVLTDRNRVATNGKMAKGPSSTETNFQTQRGKICETVTGGRKENFVKATATKEQYLKATNDENDSGLLENRDCSSTIGHQIVNHGTDNEEENHNPVNNECKNSEVISGKKINVLHNILVKSPIKSRLTPQRESSFEAQVLKHLGELAEAQKLSAERQAQTDKRLDKLDSLLNGQSWEKGHSRNAGRMLQNQSRRHDEVDSSRMVRAQPRRHEERDRVYDFDDFEELDQNFPLYEVRTVEDFEYEVRMNLEYKFLLQSRLNELSGDDPKKAIRLKMKYLFSDTVLDRYTWRGTESKRAFKKLTSVNLLILRSVREDFPKYKLHSYESYMVQWLKHSRSRQREVIYRYPNQNRGDETENEFGNSEVEEE